MSAGYKAILWNKQKRKYDLAIVGSIVLYLLVFGGMMAVNQPFTRPESIIIRGTGSLAFIMLHVILAIGPLARLNTRFLPLLYNRRHLGVSMFLIALIHGVFCTIQFHTLGDLNPLVSIFISDNHYDIASQFPFQPLGFVTLLILFVMAATSHDFWLKNLSPRIWKGLHMMVYVAYALILGHVVFGILQYEAFPLRYILVALGAVAIIGLHISAGLKSRRDIALANRPGEEMVKVCAVADIPEDRAKMAICGDQEIAVFKYDGKVSAIHNLCKHQNGPLSEGKVIDGCVTCPWHGYQYLPGDGCSPPPFTEKVSTYKVEIREGFVFVDPNPLPEGTAVEPARIDAI